MKFSPVEFTPPEPARVVLDNGMVVYLLEDHELPLVNLSATMRTGGWLEPADKVGLAAMTGAVMRTGGGGGMTAEQIDEELEQFAIDINVSMGRQSGSASLDVLSKDLGRGVQIFAGLLAAACVRTPSCRTGQAADDRGHPAPSGQPGVDRRTGISQAAVRARAPQRPREHGRIDQSVSPARTLSSFTNEPSIPTALFWESRAISNRLR